MIQFPAALAAGRRLSRRNADQIVRGLALAADKTPAQSPQQFPLRYADINHPIQPPGLFDQGRRQGLGLGRGPGKAIQDKPLFRRQFQRLLQDDADDHFIRHQGAPVHIGRRLQAQVGLLLQMVAEQIARTEMGYIQLFLEPLGLSAFAGSRRPEQRQPQGRGHAYLKNPS